ncbi:MAG TPA: MFS transporter [Candidatus Baltobacteraceae bacterium]|nr:MFS transporter [Candidatus Baltobacteraceae bacterium]
MTDAEGGRPTASLPAGQLVRLSLYWLGLSSIFTGLSQINQGRLEYTNLVGPDDIGTALFFINVGGAVIALLLQPTIGTLSDYTITRWGRRKPYIFVGSLLDVVFLLGVGASNTLLGIAVFIVLLQISSNVAQGPFQGYVPDLVPPRQVGLASALVGLFSVLGNIVGYLVGTLAVVQHDYLLGAAALALIELSTMLSVVIRVKEGRTPKARAGRSWRTIALEAWGTDILREHSFVALVRSRLFVLMGAAMIIQVGLLYLAQTFSVKQGDLGPPNAVIVAIAAIGNVLAVVPAGRLSDRIGRKTVIYAACAFGAVGMLIIAFAPAITVAFIGVGFYAVGSGMFLAVDWALMTDIIPKAATGRYMGMSNVATASAGILALGFGGLLLDLVNRLLGFGTGPRAAFLLAAVFFVLGAIFLRPVDPRRREDLPVAPA